MEVILWVFCLVVLGIIAYCGIDLWSRERQISNMIGALLLILLGTVFILIAIEIWVQVTVQFVTIGDKEFVAILTEDFSKILGAVGLGTAGMSIITGGFSLIAGGKYEVKISSTEPIEGIQIKK